MIDTGTKVTVSPVLSSGSTTPNLSSGTVQSKSLVQTQPMLSFASPPVMDFSHLYEQQPSMQQQLFQMHLQQQQQLANQQQQQQLANQQQQQQLANQQQQQQLANQQQQQLANQQQQHQQGVVATNNVQQQQHVSPAPQQQSVSLQQPQQLSKGSPTQSTADGLSGHMHHPMGYNMLPSMSNMTHVDNAIANPYFHPGFHQPMQSGMVPMYGLPNPAMPSMIQQHQFQQWQLQQMQQMKSLASVPPHGYPSSLGLKRSMAEAGIVPKPLKQKMRKKKICKNPTCNTFAKGGGFCIRHGGGKRCAVAGCERLARFAGSLCYSHGITKKKYSTLSNESPAVTTTTETTTSVEAPEQKVKPQQATNQDEEKTNEEQTAESNKEAATENESENSSTKSDEASTTQVKLATTSEEANRDSSS